MIRNVLYNVAQILETPGLLSSIKNRRRVYVWINNANGKRYVGSSINVHQRFIAYLNIKGIQARLARGNSLIFSAILKYGLSSFSFMILEYVEFDVNITENDKLLKTLMTEQKYIDRLKPEYNILKLAGSNKGHKMSAEAREKISKGKKGKPSHKKGKSRTIESRILISLNSTCKKPVLVLDPNKSLIDIFDSITKRARFTGVSRFRVGRYLDSDKLVDMKYYFFTFTPPLL